MMEKWFVGGWIGQKRGRYFCRNGLNLLELWPWSLVLVAVARRLACLVCGFCLGVCKWQLAEGCDSKCFT